MIFPGSFGTFDDARIAAIELKPANSRQGGRLADYLKRAPKFVMHALATASLHRMKALIEAIQPFTVECLDNGPVCSHAGLIEAFAVARAQELR
jgi:hypothetical protein